MSLSQCSRSQCGSFMLEALIGILIFSFGVLAMIALQAKAIAVQADAQYRIEAANFADQILGQINLNVAREMGTGTVNTADLLTFSHQGAGVATSCNFSGAVSSNPSVIAWASAINSTASTVLPGSTTAMQQIAISTTDSNRVTVVICWQAPNDPATRFHRLIAYVN